jgi:predicted transcriptional regulator
MKKDDLEDILARVRTWTPELQAAAIDTLLALEQDAADIHELTDEELADIREGLAEADRGEFATEEEIAHVFRRRQ